MPRPPSTQLPPIRQLLKIMAALRSPSGCPWDREQTHRTLRTHAIEEVYELVDAIDARDDDELAEELGDLLLQVVFHCQLGRERGAFDFDDVCRRIAAKLIRRHPHVFGGVEVSGVAEVWRNWERIKKEEKAGTGRERVSALDGVPVGLPGLLRGQKLFKKAAKAGLADLRKEFGESSKTGSGREGVVGGRRRGVGRERDGMPATVRELGSLLVRVCAWSQAKGWDAEAILREALGRREREWRRRERLPPGGRAGTKR